MSVIFSLLGTERQGCLPRANQLNSQLEHGVFLFIPRTRPSGAADLGPSFAAVFVCAAWDQV